jgi:tRNA (guanine-N7-)-methyltransferase
LKTESVPASASLIVSLPSIIEPLDVNTLFPDRRPLQVELGSGDGSFLAQYAAQHPEWNFIGVERLLGRLRKLDRKGRRAGLTNLRCVRIEAAYFLDFLLPKNSAAAIHVYFPDPWPKRKHRKHRLINERFPELARGALAPNGVVYLRTDDSNYFAQMNGVFESCAFFSPIATSERVAAVVTDFERGFTARGVQTLRCAWRLT